MISSTILYHFSSHVVQLKCIWFCDVCRCYYCCGLFALFIGCLWFPRNIWRKIFIHSYTLYIRTPYAIINFKCALFSRHYLCVCSLHCTHNLHSTNYEKRTWNAHLCALKNDSILFYSFCHFYARAFSLSLYIHLFEQFLLIHFFGHSTLSTTK